MEPAGGGDAVYGVGARFPDASCSGGTRHTVWDGGDVVCQLWLCGCAGAGEPVCQHSLVSVLQKKTNWYLIKECDCVKKMALLILALLCVPVMAGCGKSNTHKISITVPAGSTETFVYSDEEISPTGNQITISSGDGLGDTEVVLKAIEVKEENAYEPTYLTPGMPVKMDVEKGAWFKVGISMQNETDADRTVYVQVKDVEVRIE